MPLNIPPPADLSTIVHGPCVVYFGVGDAGPLYFLGSSQDGGRKTTRQMNLEIPTDLAGPMAPHDFQRMGKVADLNIGLSQVSLVNLEIMEAAIDGGAASGGGYPRGIPIAANGLHLRVTFTSALEIKRFRTCIIPTDNKPQGTRFSTYEFQWTAWERPSLSASGTPSFIPLFDNIQS